MLPERKRGPSVRWPVILTWIGLTSASASAQEALTLEEWLDIYVSACVGGGSSFTASGSLNAGLGIALKKLGPNGEIVGQVAVSKSEYSLLSEGISNAMSDVAAGQADAVRRCLEPFRANLNRAMSQQMGGIGSPSVTPVVFLDPVQEKIVRVLGQQRGLGGETGKFVPRDQVLADSGVSDLRFRKAMRDLSSGSVFLATEVDYPRTQQSETGLPDIDFVETVTLTPRGEDYVIEMGYAD